MNGQSVALSSYSLGYNGNGGSSTLTANRIVYCGAGYALPARQSGVAFSVTIQTASQYVNRYLALGLYTFDGTNYNLVASATLTVPQRYPVVPQAATVNFAAPLAQMYSSTTYYIMVNANTTGIAYVVESSSAAPTQRYLSYTYGAMPSQIAYSSTAPLSTKHFKVYVTEKY